MAEMERCISCGSVLLDDDDVYNDFEGGLIHVKCCDPNGFVDENGNATDHVPPSFKYDSLYR